jgi:hypothetical protein
VGPGPSAANVNDTNGGGMDAPAETKTTLADRIRALQSTASRVASTN